MNATFNMDKTDRQETSIKTNEVLIKEGGKWLYFDSAHHVIIAQKLEDVLPALREVEELVQVNHWHAAGFASYEAACALDSALRARALSTLLTDNSSKVTWYIERFFQPNIPYLFINHCVSVCKD